MAIKFVLDTHALIWYLEGNPKLGQSALAVMDDETSEMVLPVIALAEAVYIVGKGRTSITTVSDLLQDVTGDNRIEIQDLTLPILQQSLAASAVPEMHDRLIVASALYLESVGHSVSLLTKDSDIQSHAPIKIIW
ncbi:MAG TPA: PIN domain-containing protein [Blastocatellia bacterium]|nr:PIN domain-containing protein [Blastocatellia bacterium]